jgi:putative transposase
MPRKSIEYVPGQSVHLIRRGINRCTIFRDEVERGVFVTMFKDAAAKYGLSVHAFVLMDTHYHALVTPLGPDALTETTRSLNERYVRYVNHKYDRVGTLWTNAPTTIAIDTDQYWLTCLRYIEQNPLRAGMVLDPGEYRWSSYRTHAFGERSEWLVEHELYRRLGRTPEERQTAYRAICGVPMTDEELALHRNRPHTRRSSPLASQSVAVA